MGILQKPYQADVSPGFNVSGCASGHSKSSPLFCKTGETTGASPRSSVCHIASHTNGAACMESSVGRMRSDATLMSCLVSFVNLMRMNAPCGLKLTCGERRCKPSLVFKGNQADR
ncbi:hypothetical protein [Prevotella melaninogenica]|uniref:hypothetical protein n=1 Tax=Prevotella melaninogenica TaxID=28132 RepID=UPI002151196A|nr:hypothetical protein [Prevotella melaninogenica]